jgi:hypothetical protein
MLMSATDHAVNGFVALDVYSVHGAPAQPTSNVSDLWVTTKDAGAFVMSDG